MATLGVKGFELVFIDEYDAGNVFHYLEEASQTFKAKDPVVLDATSKEVELAADTNPEWVGFALEDASGTAGTEIEVLVVQPTMYFSVSVSTAGAALATAVTHVGTFCSFIKSTETGETDKTVLDIADTTNDFFEVVALDTRDEVGDTNGRVIVRPNPAYLKMVITP